MDLHEAQYIFYERMLSLQFWASREFEHKVTKGRVREEFIFKMINERISNININKGIISGKNSQSTEADFLKLKCGAICHTGTYEMDDCLIFMEIKSKAKKAEFNHLQSISKKMKHKNSRLLTGIFCYSTQASEKTIMKNFGFAFDNAILGYKSYNHLTDKFPDIDFCFCLNIDETDFFNPNPFFLHLDSSKSRIMYRGAGGQSIANFFNQIRYEGV